MTALAFQGAIAGLVTDRGLRERVLNGYKLPDLSDDEQCSVRQLAGDRGVRLTAALVSSFRLGKLLTLLPLTREVLGNKVFAAEVDRFWSAHPPTSFYNPDEALAFCDHLLASIAEGEFDSPLLRRVVALERAEVLVRRPTAPPGA